MATAMTAVAPAAPGVAALEPLSFLARIAQTAAPPEAMPSLSYQLASAISQLGSFLRVRGEESVEHHFAAALTLACLEPAHSDIRPYEAILLAFIRYDRRAPALPLVGAGDLRIRQSH